MLSADVPPYLRIDLAGTTLMVRVWSAAMCVRSKTSPRMDVYTLFGLFSCECSASSWLLNMCSRGQMRGEMIAMTNTAQAQTNQMIMLIASFSRHACRTSSRFIRPTFVSTKFGMNQVSIQQRSTHLRRADDSFTTSVVSPSWISPAIASLSRRPFPSAFWNMLREGAYDSVPKLDIEASSRWLV